MAYFGGEHEPLNANEFYEMVSKLEHRIDVVVIAELLLAKLFRDVLGIAGIHIEQFYFDFNEFMTNYNFAGHRVFLIGNHDLGDINGYEITKYIKRRDSRSYVLVLTANAGTEEEYYRCGADAWLLKPTTIRNILSAVVQACRTVDQWTQEESAGLDSNQ